MSTDAEKLRIAAHYLLSSPPAQIVEVERDVRTLLGATVLGDETAEEVYSRYNAANLVAVRVEADAHTPTETHTDGHVMLVSEEGRVDSTHFIDSSARVIRGVNNRAAAITDEPPTDASARFEASLEAHRHTLLQVLRAHVGATYNPLGSGTTPWAKGAEVFTTAGDAGAMQVVASCTIRNLPNFWSGAWKLRARVVFPAGAAAGRAQVAGTITITTHYFEAANTQVRHRRQAAVCGLPSGARYRSPFIMQMHDDKQFGPVDVEYTDADTFAKAAVKAIASAEDKLQDGLSEMYDAMSTHALKEMRRFLPVSGQKMNWNVAEHRMRKTLTSTAGGAAAAASPK